MMPILATIKANNLQPLVLTLPNMSHKSNIGNQKFHKINLSKNHSKVTPKDQLRRLINSFSLSQFITHVEENLFIEEFNANFKKLYLY